VNTAVSVSRWRHPRFGYLEAKSVDEACALLEEHRGKAYLVAGGTDLMVAMRNGKIAPPENVISIKKISDLGYIREEAGELKIGALATLDDICHSDMVKERFPLIAESARQIGSRQIRNAGTIGGNLCNAAPSADMAPCLIGLGARAVIRSSAGSREVALEEFFRGPGQTGLGSGEMLVEIAVPEQAPYTGGAYIKLPARTAIDLALVGVACVITLDAEKSKASEVRIVLGAVAPVPMRACKAEDILRSALINNEAIDASAEIASQEARPISDVRGSAEYRRAMVKVLTRNAIKQAVARA
jgi:aerobic carbon-monoxide dehydrogenase medium subunit